LSRLRWVGVAEQDFWGFSKLSP